jgi:hypothetical protein
MNTNLLKEAIAEADAIKKMAIENAKASLNEAFDSKVKAMLAARLSEEVDDAELEEDYEEGYDDKEKMDEKKHEDGDDEGYGMEEAEKDMDYEDEAYSEGDEDADEAFDLDEILAELEKGGDDGEDKDAEEEDSEKGDMDEAKDDEGNEDMKEAKDEDKEESVDEEIDIAKLLAEMGDEEEVKEAKHDDDDDDDHENDDDKDEVAILEEEMMSLLEKMKMAKEAKENKKQKKNPEAEELQEIKRQAAELAQKVNETNLINAKLLYLNKILRKYNLSEQQKLKVISAFDKAGTTREAKIVHESLDQAFSVKNDNTKGSLKESIGFASKAAGTSTKRVINEGVITNADAQVSRWQKLAGIIK